MSPPHRIALRRGELVRPLRIGRSATDGGMSPAGEPANWPSHRPLALGRSELAREWMVAARAFLYDAALSSARPTGCALHGASLLANAPKGTKKSCPCIRVSLRSTALIPSLLRGSPRKGHPWPFTGGTPSPFAASMPLTPLRSDSIRPSERGVRCRLVDRAHGYKQSDLLLPLFKNFQTTRTQFPFRRPNVGAAQGDARHGCRARSDGTWMSLRDGPRSGAGAREVLRSKTRMLGWPSFWLLFLGHSRKSDSPSRAKPMPQPSTIKSCGHQTPKKKASRASSLLRKPLTKRARQPQRGVAPTPNQKRSSVCA